MAAIRLTLFGLLAMTAVMVTACSDKKTEPVAQQQKELPSPPQETVTDYSDWQQVVAKASGQTVYWNAWGGSDQINRYIGWVGEQLTSRYNIQLKHVKVDDIALSINRVLAEFSAGKHSTGGSVDLMWINGENFRSMKEHKLLFGPFTHHLPHYTLVDTVNKPTTLFDFGTPVDGLESAWGMAQLVFIYDSARITQPPKNIVEMLEHGRNNPGRIAYPKPPNYLGTTFLKQALYHFVDDQKVLQNPVSEADFDAVTADLWSFLDEFHKYAWNTAHSFPKSGPDQTRLLNDNEIDFSLAFNPAEASANILEGLLQESARTFVFDNGSIGNTHFVAIPINANAKEAAMVAANFLLSPEAQIRKQDPQYFGDFTVLDVDRLPNDDQQAFRDLPLGVATLPLNELGFILPEPHSSWVQALENAWNQRYLQ